VTTTVDEPERARRVAAEVLRLDPGEGRAQGAPFTLDGIREVVRDIAGIRITCSFTSDVYRLMDMITCQRDLDPRMEALHRRVHGDPAD